VQASIQQIPSGPSGFGVLLSVDDRLELTTTDMLGVAIKSDQTLASFKEDVFHKYGLQLSDYTLILIGRELKDDDKILGDLGFIPGCTVHAGKYIYLSPSLTPYRPSLQLRKCNSAFRHRQQETLISLLAR
jgi:Ubiquitin family